MFIIYQLNYTPIMANTKISTKQLEQIDLLYQKATEWLEVVKENKTQLSAKQKASIKKQLKQIKTIQKLAEKVQQENKKEEPIENEGFDFTKEEIPTLSDALLNDAEALEKVLEKLQKQVDNAEQEGLGKKKGEMSKADSNAIQIEIKSIEKFLATFKAKHSKENKGAVAEMVDGYKHRLSIIKNQFKGISIAGEKSNVKLSTGATKSHVPVDEPQKKEDEEQKPKPKVKDLAKNASTQQLMQKADLNDVKDTRKQLKETTDPVKKKELEEQLKKKEEDFEKAYGSKPKTDVQVKAKVETGFSASFDSSGLTVAAMATAGVSCTVTPPKIMIPAIASELGVTFGLSASITGEIKALISNELLKTAAAKNSITTPMDYNTAVTVFNKHKADLGTLTLTGSITNAVKGNIEVSLTVAKLLKLAIDTSLVADLTVSVSTELGKEKVYTLGSASGGITLAAAASIGPSDEVASLLPNDIVKKLTASFPLGKAVFFIIKPKGNATYDNPTDLFKSGVEIKEGPALISLKNKIVAIYEQIKEYVYIVGDTIEAVADFYVDGTKKVADGLNELRTFDQMASFEFGPKRKSKKYNYDEKMYFDFYVRMTGKSAVNFSDYDIKIDLALYFNGKKIDWINTRNETIDDGGGSYSNKYYVNFGGFNKKAMKAMYQKLGREKFIQAVQTGLVTVKGKVSVDGVAKVVSGPHRMMITVPQNYDFDKHFK